MKHCLVTGGSGFIGRALCQHLVDAGWQVSVLSRDPVRARDVLPGTVHLISKLAELDKLPAVWALVNLAGEPLAGRRWTERRKAEFVASRVNFTVRLRTYFCARGQTPAVVVNGSAIGYYGPQDDTVLDENAVAEDSFSHRLCRAWEDQSLGFAALGSRVCRLRTGVILDRGGGALASLLPLFRFGLGGPVGSGEQYLSWIHRQDLVALILYALDTHSLSGPLNGTAPGAVTSREFARVLGRVLHRPAVVRSPAWAMRLAFGEMAEELLLSGQRVYPARALESGFRFTYSELEAALAAILIS